MTDETNEIELPDEVVITEIDEDIDIEDKDELADYIGDVLGEEYGFCIEGMAFDVDEETGVITVTNIAWDMDDENDYDFDDEVESRGAFYLRQNV